MRITKFLILIAFLIIPLAVGFAQDEDKTLEQEEIINKLYQKAEEYFSAGEYEKATEIYEKIATGDISKEDLVKYGIVSAEDQFKPAAEEALAKGEKLLNDAKGAQVDKFLPQDYSDIEKRYSSAKDLFNSGKYKDVPDEINKMSNMVTDAIAKAGEIKQKTEQEKMLAEKSLNEGKLLIDDLKKREPEKYEPDLFAEVNSTYELAQKNFTDTNYLEVPENINKVRTLTTDISKNIDIALAELAKAKESELAKLEDEKKKAEELAKLEAQKLEEEKRKAEELAKLEAAKLPEEKKKLEELAKLKAQKLEEEKRKAEELAKLEAQKIEEEKRKAEELAKLEAEKLTEEKKKLEELAKAKEEEEKRKAEELAALEAKRLEEERKLLEAGAEEIDYVVKKGDTLVSISASPDIYDNPLKWKKIYNSNKNKIKDPNFIYPGQVLKIKKPVYAIIGGRTHTVKYGESLSSISKKYYGKYSGWNKIYQQNKNRILDPTQIFPGQVFTIP